MVDVIICFLGKIERQDILSAMPKSKNKPLVKPHSQITIQMNDKLFSFLLEHNAYYDVEDNVDVETDVEVDVEVECEV